MTFEQSGMVPRSNDQPSPMLFPQLFPDRTQPTPEVRPEIPLTAPEPAKRIDTVKLMEEWETAFDKASSTWSAGLTKKGLDERLAANDLTEEERKALLQMKANFQDLCELDGGSMPTLTKSDLSLFKVLLTNTDRDIQYHEKGQKFLADNKEKLDTNKDGKVDWHEIYKARTNPDYGADVQDTIKYLSDRYSYNLGYKNVEKTAMAFNALGGTTVPEEDYKPGNLGKIVDATQELAFKYKVVDDLRTATTMVGVVGGSTIAKYFELGPWGTAGAILGTSLATAFIVKQTAQYLGPVQQDGQEERIKRLMTSIANINY